MKGQEQEVVGKGLYCRNKYTTVWGVIFRRNQTSSTMLQHSGSSMATRFCRKVSNKVGIYHNRWGTGEGVDSVYPHDSTRLLHHSSERKDTLPVMVDSSGDYQAQEIWQNITAILAQEIKCLHAEGGVNLILLLGPTKEALMQDHVGLGLKWDFGRT